VRGHYHRYLAFEGRTPRRWRSLPLWVLVLALAAPGTAAAQEEAQSQEPAAVDSFFPKPPISAGGAFLRSLIIPGWAQAELGARSRGAFYFLAESFCLFMVARTDIRLDYAQATEPENEGLVESRKQQLEDWIALAVFTALFSAADGWVSVQLFGFDERTGLTPGDVAFSVGWRVPFGP
jgi:hypothetical protein